MALPDLEPVTRESTAGIIARQLRTAIMTGALQPGAQLGEAELAAQFAVSRGPLREAMQRLVQEGLLRSERHRGLFVIELEPADVFDVYVTRNAIEQAAARLILRGDREWAASRLEAIHREMQTAVNVGDPAAVGEADALFHQVFVALAGSRRLNRMARTLLIETRMCIAALQKTYQLPEDTVAEHGAIVDAVRSGDEPGLLDLIESHMEDAVQRLAPGTSLHGAAPMRAEPEPPAVDGYPASGSQLEPGPTARKSGGTKRGAGKGVAAQGKNAARAAARSKRHTATSKTGKTATATGSAKPSAAGGKRPAKRGG